MQEKIDKLTDIINTIKKEKSRRFALTLLSEIVQIINNQEKEILSLESWKTNNKFSEIENELHKYILILITFGFSQKFIKTIRIETLIFIAKYRSKFNSFKPDEIKLIDLILMNYELEFDNLPGNYQDFKKYMDESKS